MIKVKGTVWVNEWTISGKPLKHEWYGEIIKINKQTEIATIKDTTKGMYHGETFDRILSNLEPK